MHHRGATTIPQQLFDVRALPAHDALHVAAGISHEAPCHDATGGIGDIDCIATLERALQPRDAGRQQAAARAQRPLGTGVDLRVQPLGKKVSRLSLLSGGEKSLAALAFLFAVLLGIGVDFAVHLYAQRERQGTAPDWPGVLRDHARPLWASMLTTVGSFLILMLADFKGGADYMKDGNLVCASPKVFKPLMQAVEKHMGKI